MDNLSGQKILIISDLHLGRKFSQKKSDILEKIIGDCDKVIINGDFYEGYAMNINRFLKSKWQTLFPTLLKKKAVYVFGNHDRVVKKLSDCKKFSISAGESYDFSQNGAIFHAMHGHVADPTFDVKHHVPNVIMEFVSFMDGVAIKRFGNRYLKRFDKENRLIKTWKKKNIPEKDWLICGHTHLAEIDKPARYANSGNFKSLRAASYLIIENGKVKLHNING
jgi:predicted phosphodiesterase